MRGRVLGFLPPALALGRSNPRTDRIVQRVLLGFTVSGVVKPAPYFSHCD
jgi:hypothetical protein